MSEWIFNRNGQPKLLFDQDCIRNNSGQVIAYINNTNIHTMKGQHMGWFESGIFYDSANKAIGFLKNRIGTLPSTPGLAGSPGIPGFAGKPGRPGLGGAPGKPGRGGWSSNDLVAYFTI